MNIDILRLATGFFIEAMQHALNAGAENIRSMGEHNFEAAKKLRWDDIAKRTYEVYEECLARGK